MSYGIEWTPGAVLLGMVLLVAIVPHFALIGLVVVAIAVLAALVVLAAALLAMPYVLLRIVRRRHAERHRRTQGSAPIATAVGPPALAEPPTARRSR